MRVCRLPVISFIFIFLMNAGNALSDPPNSTVVYPTGVFPDDLVSVQQAVDGGGTVMLESVNLVGEPTAFNFGPPSLFPFVLLTVDVEILGGGVSASTRIEGGWVPFFGRGHTTTRIENITFDGAGLSAALFLRSTGVQFVGNHVTGVVGTNPPPGFPIEGRGIKFLGNDDPGAFVGDIEVIGNRFDNMHADFSDAIVFDSVAADTYIADNEVQDIGGAGVLAIAQGGDMEITRNTIIPGPGSSPFHLGDGIVLIGGAGRYTVTRNTIRCENFLAEPILLIGHDGTLFPPGPIDAPIITQNKITRVGPAIGGGISFWGDVDNAYVTANRITGSSPYAIAILPFISGESALGNAIAGNNIVHYDPTWAHTVVWSHATGTHVIGNAGSVFDIGQDTVITGEGPVAGGFAGGWSQAHQAAVLKRSAQLRGEHRP